MAGKFLEKIVWAKVFVEESEISKQACQLLRDAGLFVNTIPVIGMWGPVAFIQGRVYEGLEQIKKYTEQYRNQQTA